MSLSLLSASGGGFMGSAEKIVPRLGGHSEMLCVAGFCCRHVRPAVVAAALGGRCRVCTDRVWSLVAAGHRA